MEQLKLPFFGREMKSWDSCFSCKHRTSAGNCALESFKCLRTKLSEPKRRGRFHNWYNLWESKE